MTRPSGTEASALVVEVPEADPVVGAWRERFDPVALAGMPAHVTLLYPFRPPTDIDEAVLGTALDVIGDEAPFAASFRTVATFPDRVVYLVPEPADPFARLTARLAEAFPDCPPYGGRFPDSIPHLTVGLCDTDDHLAQLVQEVTEGLAVEGVSITTEVAVVALFSRDETGRWIRRTRIPLGTAVL